MGGCLARFGILIGLAVFLLGGWLVLTVAGSGEVAGFMYCPAGFGLFIMAISAQVNSNYKQAGNASPVAATVPNGTGGMGRIKSTMTILALLVSLACFFLTVILPQLVDK